MVCTGAAARPGNVGPVVPVVTVVPGTPAGCAIVTFNGGTTFIIGGGTLLTCNVGNACFAGAAGGVVCGAHE